MRSASAVSAAHRQDAAAVLQIDDVAARAAHAARVHRLDRLRLDVEVDHRDAAQPRRIGVEGVEHRPVVGAVDARLHEHGALDAERVEHVAVVGGQRIGRRVDAVRRVRVARRRAAHVRMAIARERRRGDGRGTRGRVVRRAGRDRIGHGLRSS